MICKICQQKTEAISKLCFECEAKIWGFLRKDKGKKIEIPKLYETENTPFEQKVIYQHWEMPLAHFHWLIAEVDEKKQIAFGYANLNNDQNAEWGYIDLQELKRVGAMLDKDWKPCLFPEALKRLGLEEGLVSCPLQFKLKGG